METTKQGENTPNNHLNALAKVKKAIAVALMTGMLANPGAAKGLKNRKVNNEPTQVERNEPMQVEHSAEQVSPEVIYNDAMKLLEDLINSGLYEMEALNPNDMLKQAPAIKSETEKYLARLGMVIQDLGNYYNGKIDYDSFFRGACEAVTQGHGRQELRQYYSYMALNICEQTASLYEKNGIVKGSIVWPLLLTEFYACRPGTEKNTDYFFTGAPDSDYLKTDEYQGICGNLNKLLNDKEDKSKCLENLEGNFDNIAEIMTPEWGDNKAARKTFVALSAILPMTERTLQHLYQLGFNVDNYRTAPAIRVQQQVGQEMGL